MWSIHDTRGVGKQARVFLTIASALAFAREVQDAEIHLLNAGHFALDEEAEMIAALISKFLDALGRMGRKAIAVDQV
jgi:hypothetical protein